MGFPRQEYWSGLSFPSPGGLPDLGTQSMSPILAGGFFCLFVCFTAKLSGKPPTSIGHGYVQPSRTHLSKLLRLEIDILPEHWILSHVWDPHDGLSPTHSYITPSPSQPPQYPNVFLCFYWYVCICVCWYYYFVCKCLFLKQPCTSLLRLC